MDQSRARYLIIGLLGNKLSGQELDEVLCGLNSQITADEYSSVLKQYFDQLVEEKEKVCNGVTPDGFEKKAGTR